MIETQDLTRQLEQQLAAVNRTLDETAPWRELQAENKRLKEKLSECERERDAWVESFNNEYRLRISAEKERDELVSNSYKLGTCVKCGNPSQDSTKEHFVVATASEGVSPPEDSNPQRVEAPHHFSQPANMVDRIADILVEDHVALMNELATVTKERDELVAAVKNFVSAQTHDEMQLVYRDADAILAKVGADKEFKRNEQLNVPD